MKKEIEVFEKELLGKAMREMFFEINAETDERFRDIKEKFLNAQIGKEEEIFIETVLVEENEAFKLDGIFFPIINKAERNFFEENIYLENVYINEQFGKMEEIVNEKFSAWINIEGESHEIKVVLKRDNRYFDEIKKLYDAFELNGKTWKTLNMAHFMRCYRIKLVEYEFEMTKEILEKIENGETNILYEFGEHDEKILRNKELLWNVEKKKIISTIFVRPVKIDLSFEYTINYENYEQILVSNFENDDILCCYNSEKNKLNIISKKNNGDIWNIFSIKSVEKCKKILEMYKKSNADLKNYFHFTNMKNRSFIDKIQKNRMKIRSRAFLEKYFSEYEFTRNDIILKDLNFEKEIEPNVKIYDCNENLKNEFEKSYFFKRIKLNFFVENKNFDEYFEDKLSFLISEIQNNFEEFECRGYLYGE